MRKYLTLATLVLMSTWTLAQQNETGIVKIRGTRLVYPLVNTWIEAFAKEHPGINVQIAPTAPADSIDFTIAAYALTDADLPSNRSGVAITRYVQLPVANSHRPDIAQWQARGFSDDDFKKLYFTPAPPNFMASASNASPITVYTREKPACAAKTFAAHYGNDPQSLQGVGVKGDDQDLAKAVKNDVNGVSFNNLGFIYDVKTRKVLDNLAVIPLDINGNGKIDAEEQVYHSLDAVIGYVEKTNSDKFVDERVNVLFNKNSSNAAAGIFLQWVLTKGQQYNHTLGFLNLDEKVLNDQRAIASATFKEISVSSCEGADALMKARSTKKSAQP